jgi:putative endopeptidase
MESERHDLGGLRLALGAFLSTEQFKEGKAMDGVTPTQRFFLAWAQCWRHNMTKVRSLQLLALDPHGLMEMSCNGPLSIMQSFMPHLVSVSSHPCSSR